jgi:hypothetical protein
LLAMSDKRYRLNKQAKSAAAGQGQRA